MVDGPVYGSLFKLPKDIVPVFIDSSQSAIG